MYLFQKDVPGGDALKALKEAVKKMKPDWNIKDLGWEDLKNLLKSQDVSIIRKELINVIKFVFAQLEYAFLMAKKVFYIFPVVFLMRDAFRYMVQYQSDVTFDNMYIDSNIKNHDGKHLLPLRRWERKERYQVSASLKLSSDEWHNVFLQMIPSLIFAAGTTAIFIVDFSISSFLYAIKDKAKFTISFEGRVVVLALVSTK